MKKEPPKDHLGGKRKAVFEGHVGSATGQTLPGIPTGDCWSFGLRRRISLSPADMGWKKTMTPGDARTYFTVPSRSGRFLQGAQESVSRPEHLFIQPELPGGAFGFLLKPTTH